jgi:hypothetical protein
MAEHRLSQLLTGSHAARVEDTARLLWAINYLHRPRPTPSGRVPVDPVTNEPVHPQSRTFEAKWLLEALQATRGVWLTEQVRRAQLPASPSQRILGVNELVAAISPPLEDAAPSFRARLVPVEMQEGA